MKLTTLALLGLLALCCYGAHDPYAAQHLIDSAWHIARNFS